MRFLHGGVALLGFLADGEQPHRGILAAEDVTGVHVPEARELDEFGGGAVDVGAGVEDDDRLLGGREDRADGRAREALVQAQEDRGRGHLGAGVAGGDEGVGLAFGLELDADGHRRVGLSADGDRGFVGHLDDVRGVDDLQTRRRFDHEGRSGGELRVQLLADDAFASDELELVRRTEFLDHHQCGRDRRRWGVVAPHRIQGDASHGVRRRGLRLAARRRRSRSSRTHGAGASSRHTSGTPGC